MSLRTERLLVSCERCDGVWWTVDSNQTSSETASLKTSVKYSEAIAGLNWR